MLFYRVLADLIVVIHLAYVGFVVVGMVLILAGVVRRWGWVRNFWFRIAHFAAIALVAAESLGGIVCPLTDWEYRLRVAGGEEGEPGSFVGRVIHAMMFFQDVPEWGFTVVYCLFALAVLATLLLAPPHWPKWRKSGKM